MCYVQGPPKPVTHTMLRSPLPFYAPSESQQVTSLRWRPEAGQPGRRLWSSSEERHNFRVSLSPRPHPVPPTTRGTSGNLQVRVRAQQSWVGGAEDPCFHPGLTFSSDGSPRMTFSAEPPGVGDRPPSEQEGTSTPRCPLLSPPRTASGQKPQNTWAFQEERKMKHANFSRVLY